jgi:hypothetical protein
MPDITKIELTLLYCLGLEKAITIKEYRITSPQHRLDRENDLIVGVDGQINLTAIARAIVEASHER